MTVLLRRLRQLRGWEAVNVLFMPAIFVWIWLRPGCAIAWQVRLPPLVMVSYVLAQGTLYWHPKLQSARGRAPLPAWFCPTFRNLYRRVISR